MIKYKKIITAAVAVISVILQTASVHAYESTGLAFPENAPSENVFRVKGSEQEFILLDTADDKNSTFFVMAKGFFGRKAFDTSGSILFNPGEASNIGYFLNNAFLELGGEDGFVGVTRKLPDALIKHIDKTHIWECEKGAAGAEYTVTCGVALPSVTEIEKYSKKIGYNDGTLTEKYTPLRYGWWTRTQSNAPGSVATITLAHSTTATGWWGASDGNLTYRPVFWLDEEFFKKVPIDLTTAGENVLKQFKPRYTIGELSKLYSKQQIWDYLGYKSDVSLTAEFTQGGKKIDSLKGKDEVTAVINVKNNSGREVAGMVILAAFDADNTPIVSVSEELSLSLNEEGTSELTSGFTGKAPAYVKAYYIDINMPLEAISNTVRLYK